MLTKLPSWSKPDIIVLYCTFYLLLYLVYDILFRIFVSSLVNFIIKVTLPSGWVVEFFAWGLYRCVVLIPWLFSFEKILSKWSMYEKLNCVHILWHKQVGLKICFWCQLKYFWSIQDTVSSASYVWCTLNTSVCNVYRRFIVSLAWGCTYVNQMSPSSGYFSLGGRT